MTSLDDRAVARIIRQQSDARARAIVASALPRYVWAVADEIGEPDEAGHAGECSAFLAGSSEVSRGINWTLLGRRPVPGDLMLVELPPPGGTRRVVAIDREDVAGSGALDLDALDELGLATDKELTDHGLQGHLVPLMTHNTAATDSGHWTKIAQGSIDSRYGQISGWFVITGNGAVTAIGVRGWVWYRIKQQDDFGNDPEVYLTLQASGNLSTTDLVVVVTSNAGPTTYELYLRLTRANEWAEYTPLPPSNAGVMHTWLGCEPFITSLPAGTQTSAI